jgi:hypothetical protein
MRTLTIEIDNDQDIPKLLEFMKPLNMRIKEESETTKRLEAVQATFGIIKQDKVIDLDSLRRENLYDQKI